MVILVMWPEPFKQTFLHPIIRSFQMKLDVNWPSGLKKTLNFDTVFGSTDDGHKSLAYF